MKKIITVMLAAICVISLVACGKGDYEYAANDAYDYRDYDFFESETVSTSEAYYEGADIQMLDSSVGTQNNVASEVKNNNRKLIKTVDMSVETLDFDSLIVNIDKKIAELGGYSESKSVSGTGYEDYSNRRAFYTARIPSDKLNDFVMSVGEVSNVTNKSEKVQDVTLNYVDIEAHLSSVKVEYTRLNELLAEADSLETIIALENRLAEVRYEIEAYESSLRSIDNQVDYSTVYISVSEVKIYTPVVVEKQGVWQRISVRFKNNLERAGEDLGDFFVNVVSGIPTFLVGLFFVLIWVIIIFAVLLIIRRIYRAYKGKNEKNAEKREAKKLKRAQKKDKESSENSEN